MLNANIHDSYLPDKRAPKVVKPVALGSVCYDSERQQKYRDRKREEKAVKLRVPSREETQEGKG